jgi:hypothetical protein
MVWASPTTVSAFSGWSAGHSNRDGVRSGTKSCPLDGPIPPVTPSSMIHSTRQAPRNHGAERKYYMFGSARHPDKSNRRPPIHTRSISGLVLHILRSYRLKRHLETRSLWWHWHRVTGSVRASIRRARGGEVWSAAAHLQVHANANLSNVFASTFEAETEEVVCAVS